MWFDPYAYLADLRENDQVPANSANPANLGAAVPPISGTSEISRGRPIPYMASAKRSDHLWPPNDRRWRARLSGLSVTDVIPALTGRRKTWSGRMVSADEWTNLSMWDRHGSTGKVWNGITAKWEDGEAS